MNEWFNAGRISPVPSGTWNDTTEYKRLDIVTDHNMQRSYIAKKDVPAGTLLTDANYWQLLVETFHAVSLKTAADRLASPFSETSSAVACHPVEDYPLDVVTHIEPVQEGSGDPSPDNIRPITGHTGDVLTRCGKNLFSDDKLTIQDKNIRAYFNDPEGFLLHAGMTYTLSLGGTAANAIYVTTMDKVGGDGDIAKAYSETSLTFTPSETVRAQFNAYWTNGRPTDTYMMLELGSTATAYEPYNAETFTADFNQTVYGGTLDWNTGVLTVDRAMRTFDGSENWSASGTQFVDFVAFNLTVNDKYYGNNVWTLVLCNAFRSMATSADYQTGRTESGGVGGVGGYGNIVTFKADRAVLNGVSGTNSEALDKWESFLASQSAAGTPVQIVYKLNTPITIQLTPQDILALGGVNTLYAEAGDVTVDGRISPVWMNEQLKSAIIALGGNV